MDREALTREVRRRQALEALEFERARAEALRERLEVIVAELDGPALDERIFAGMEAGEIEIVRPAVQTVDLELYEPEESDEGDGTEALTAAQEHAAYQESEVERLAGEIESSLVRQRAFERYVELLGR